MRGEYPEDTNENCIISNVTKLGSSQCTVCALFLRLEDRKMHSVRVTFHARDIQIQHFYVICGIN